MSVKLLTDHYLELLSLKGGCTGSSEATQNAILFGNHMSRLNYIRFGMEKLSYVKLWIVSPVYRVRKQWHSFHSKP